MTRSLEGKVLEQLSTQLPKTDMYAIRGSNDNSS
jgi:hypothetical protein